MATECKYGIKDGLLEQPVELRLQTHTVRSGFVLFRHKEPKRQGIIKQNTISSKNRLLKRKEICYGAKMLPLQSSVSDFDSLHFPKDLHSSKQKIFM